MTTRIYSDGQCVDKLDPRDRGLAYGDGVFETILIHQDVPVWWDAHLARLLHGCEVLGIAPPDPGFLRAACNELAIDCMRGVLKLIVTRGIGERGYAQPLDASPTIVITLSDAPAPPPRDGLVLRWCETPLAIQPRLASIKHLNRLEQVLARAEWDDAAIHEGLQCDASGRVVCATAANLFALRDGRWLTPPVLDCGIAGVCRAWLLDRIPGSSEAVLTRSDVESAEALVLSNSVRGILTVAVLGSRRWSPHPRATALQQRLADAEPAFGRTHTQDSSEDA